MSRRFTILLAVAVGTVMAYGVTGTRATFRFETRSAQRIAVGSLEVAFDSSTPGATITGNTITCPPLAIASPSGPEPSDGAAACSIGISSVGSIPLARLTLKITVESDGAHLDRFAVTPTGVDGSPAFILLDVPPGTTVATVTSFPAAIDLPVSWGSAVGAGVMDLDVADMGKSIVVTYTISAIE